MASNRGTGEGVRPLRIAVFGLFGSPNLGNEATLAAFLHHVARRLPGVRFVCIAPAHYDVRGMHGTDHLEIDPLRVGSQLWRVRPAALRRWAGDALQRISEPLRVRRAAALLDDCTALAIPGTGVIDDFGQSPLDLPAHLDRWTAAAARRGLPIGFLGIGAATVRSAESRRLFRRALARAADCSFRDGESLDVARSLGYQGDGTLSPDLAFSLPLSIAPSPPAGGSGSVVAIGVMGYFGWNRSEPEGVQIYRNYLAKLTTLLEGLLADGHEVHLLCGDTRADAVAVRDLLAEANRRWPGARVRAPHIASYADALQAIAATSIVAATRFHNVLFALLLGRATVSIGYSGKNDALMADFGRSAYCHAVETFAADAVLQQIRSLAARPDAGFAAAMARVASRRAALDAQYDRFCARMRTR